MVPHLQPFDFIQVLPTSPPPPAAPVHVGPLACTQTGVFVGTGALIRDSAVQNFEMSWFRLKLLTCGD